MNRRQDPRPPSSWKMRLQSCGSLLTLGEESAGIDHTEHTEYDEHDNGNDEIAYAALGVVHGLGRFDVLLAGGEEVALCNGVVFMLFHGAVVKFGNGHEYHHDNGEQRIEVVGNGADKKLHAVVNAGTAGKAGNGGRQEEMGAIMQTGAAVASIR